MSDIGVAEIPIDEDEQPLPPIEAPGRNGLVDGPILRTLLWLAWPNVVALSAGTCVVIAETSYIGRLGVESLAAMALVFPFVILTMTMSGGAMGGGVASAIARALGAGDTDRASTLAAHALLIGICFGLMFMLVMLIFGPRLLQSLGGRGNVLAYAIGYVQIFFGGAVVPWLLNTLAGILRGTGNMKLPSLMILSSAVCQIILGGTLGLGLGPIPQFGMRGVASGSLIAYLISISVMGWYLFSGRRRVIPKIRGLGIQSTMFADILQGGAVFCLSPLESARMISSIFPPRHRCTPSSAFPSRCIFPRKGQRKFWDRCWRRQRACYSSPPAAGGCQGTTLRPRISSLWPRHRWCCSASCLPSALCSPD